MAEEGDSGEKTEQPTARRRNESRQQGMVGQSAELSQVIGMIAAFYALKHIAPALWRDLLSIVQASLSWPVRETTMTIPVLQTKFYQLLYILLPELYVMLFIAAFFGAGCTLLQTDFLWSSKLIKPKAYRINPMAGFKRILSIQNLVNLGKSIVKLAIIAPIAYAAFFELFPQFLRMMDVPIGNLLAITAGMASDVFIRIIKLLLILGIIDLIWQKYSNNKRMKMSKQEIKEEKKATDGDEAMKRRITAIGLQRARERMFLSVPKADVVVTNPTHIAIALRYDPTEGTAPRVLAKGKGHVAERIKEIARKNGIPVIERKPLARALFKAVEIGKEIPYDLFRAVAEILAYVYRLKGKSPLKARKTSQMAADPLRPPPQG